MEKLSPEKSWNFNLNYVKDFYTKRGQVFKLDSSIFKTIFSNRIIPDYDSNSINVKLEYQIIGLPLVETITFVLQRP